MPLMPVHPLTSSLSLGLCLALAACAGAPPAGLVQAASRETKVERDVGEVSIPFANQGGIRNWQPVDDSSLLIEDSHGQWYLARLQSASGDLAFAEQVAFLTDPAGSFGRLSAVAVKGVRHPVLSLTRTQAPGKTKSALPAAKAP